MSDPKRAAAFLEMAQKDFRVLTDAGHLLDTEIIGFHAQQAAEKAIKAWLCLLDAIPPRSHDLQELAALLADLGEALPEGTEALFDLNDFAVLFRYEPFLSFDEPLDLAETIAQVDTLIRAVKDRLEQATDQGPS